MSTGQPENDDQPRRPQSLRAHVGRLAESDSGELLLKAERLRDLVQQPGWEVLVEFLSIEAAFHRASVDRSPEALASAIVDNQADVVRRLALAGGQANAYRSVPRLVAGVLAKAEQVRQAIESEGDGQ